MQPMRKDDPSSTTCLYAQESRFREGCGITAVGNTYGDAFNANGGGVYAHLLEDTRLRIWFHPRDAVPDDALGANPEPESWPSPMVDFYSSEACAVEKHWRGQTLVGVLCLSSRISSLTGCDEVINIDFCGDAIGGDDWRRDKRCSSERFPTCRSYVAANPGAYHEAYWLFNPYGIRLFQRL